MNFLTLESFVAVAECGSIRKAAKQLYITEQSLSERIKKLEAELDAPLLNRTRPQSLTPEGEILLSGAREILSLHAQTLQQIRDCTAARPAGIVRIGLDSIGYPAFLPQLVSRFTASHPRYQVEILRAAEPDAHVQAALYFLPYFVTRPMQRILLTEDSLCILVSDGLLQRTFGAEKAAVCRALSETGDLSLVQSLPFLETLHDAHSFWPMLGALSFSPHLLSLSDSRDMDYALCLSGQGAMLAAEDDIRRKLGQEHETITGQMHIFSIPSPPIGLSLCYEPGHSLSPAEQAFVSEAVSFFHPEVQVNT